MRDSSVAFSVTTLHIFSWFILIFLFIFLLIMHKGTTGRKVMHTIIRIWYFVVMYTGGALYIQKMFSSDAIVYLVKILFGLSFLLLAELTIMRANKQKKIEKYLFAMSILMLIMMTIGFYLPLGMNLLNK
ncbi:DUF1516 family protein [Kurthia sibirica]|uniref:Uncharacterized protein n=1 Tax=Kurthia sibirica TaxID=202750 RepID=A0A2U3AMR0_9BACL|nr:DUF1516 family protein [Kurthia sibirica]PWI25833.1 hypothetical protein DEX24_06420 [Kurthia sibirica]GEK33652.1 hypothetical protein KSI01_11850 [Kurthia sibirica]